MRILFASDYYPPFIGGAHRQTRLLAKEFTARGHQVAVSTLWYPGCTSRSSENGFDVYRVRQMRTAVGALLRDGQRHQPPFPDPVSAFQLRRIVRGFAPDIIHAYGGIAFSMSAALAGIRTPLVVAARDYGYGCPTRTLVYDGAICAGPSLSRCPACAMEYYGKPKGAVAVAGLAASRPLLKSSLDGLHSVSHYVEATVKRDLLHERRVASVVAPSFREDQSPIAETHSEVVRRLDSIGMPFILFVGALRREKGIEELLSAYSAIRPRPPLVLLGTVERDTPTSLPSDVTLVENATFPEVLAAWDRALFGVLPSRWPEPLGSVVYEAMSRGRAVIGSRPGGHEDMIIDGESGLLVDAGDTRALEQAMRRLIDDDSYRRLLEDGARARSEAFTAAKSVPKLEQFLIDVAKGFRDSESPMDA